MKRTHSQEKGFTLAELLVVIAIMAILIGVAVGSFTGLIGKGNEQSEDYELEAVQTAMDAYMAVSQIDTIPLLDIRGAGSATKVATGDLMATYMRRLPTKCDYWWDADGTIHQDCS